MRPGWTQASTASHVDSNENLCASPATHFVAFSIVFRDGFFNEGIIWYAALVLYGYVLYVFLGKIIVRSNLKKEPFSQTLVCPRLPAELSPLLKHKVASFSGIKWSSNNIDRGAK